MALARFSLCFCVPASSLLFCHYYRFFHRFTTLFIANFALVFPAREVVYLLLPHGRCFLLLCCCGLSRGHFNIFVFPAWEVVLLVCSLMVDVIHCIFITFYTTEFNPWYNSFSFSLCFYWHIVSLLALSHFCVVKTLLYFPGILSSLNCLLPHCRCRLFLDVAAVYLVGFLFIYLFSVCSIWLVFVTLLLLFFWGGGDNSGLVFSGVRSSLTLSVTLSIVTTLY